MGKIMTRMGSGFPVEMSESQLMEDITGGSEDAADRGKIPSLSEEELKYLIREITANRPINRSISNLSF